MRVFKAAGVEDIASIFALCDKHTASRIWLSIGDRRCPPKITFGVGKLCINPNCQQVTGTDCYVIAQDIYADIEHGLRDSCLYKWQLFSGYNSCRKSSGIAEIWQAVLGSTDR